MGKMKPCAPRGCVPVLVGTGGQKGGMQKVMVHTDVLMHPYFVVLLELAAMEFGYEQQGVLRIPCDVEHFHWIISTIARARARNSIFCCVPAPTSAYRADGFG